MSLENEGMASIDLSVFSSMVDYISTHSSNLLDRVPNHVESTISFLIIASAIAFTTSKIQRWNDARKAKLHFNDDKLRLEDVIIGVTEFKITDKKHPKTGKLLYRQCLTTCDVRALEDFFPEQWVDLIIKNLEEARNRCTEDNPCVLLHLADIIGGGDENISSNLGKLNKELVNGISKIFNDKNRLIINTARLKEGEEVVYFTHVPFLIYEEGAQKQQLRILLVRIQDLIDPKIKDLESDHIFYQDGDDEYGHEIYSNRVDHPQALRHKTLKRLIELYQENRDNFQSLRIYTDEIRPIDHNSYVLQYDDEL